MTHADNLFQLYNQQLQQYTEDPAIESYVCLPFGLTADMYLFGMKQTDGAKPMSCRFARKIGIVNSAIGELML